MSRYVIDTLDSSRTLGLEAVVNGLVGEDDENRQGMLEDGRKACVGYILACRAAASPNLDQELLMRRIDDCLVRVYSEMNDDTSAALLAFLLPGSGEFHYDVDTTLAMLHARGLHYAQSLVYRSAGMITDYIRVSLDLLAHVVEDPTFQGSVEDMVDVLLGHKDQLDNPSFWTFSKVGSWTLFNSNANAENRAFSTNRWSRDISRLQQSG